MEALNKLLVTVEKWCRKRGLDDWQTETAKSLAWFYRTKCKRDYPDSHWARVAVRAVLNRRDLPECGTGEADALNHATLGGTPDKTDKEPPPDVLASHREAWIFFLDAVTQTKRAVMSLRIQGVPKGVIARVLKLSAPRISQILNEVMAEWNERR